jgi:hypothetical protein
MGKIEFKPGSSQKYGFDSKRFDALARFYNTIEDEAGAQQYIAWKSIESSKTDAVIAKIDGASADFDQSKLVFTTPTGKSYAAQPGTETGSLQVNVMGGFEGDIEELYAYYPTSDSSGHTMGRVNVVSYQKVLKKVVLVPLPGATNLPTASQISLELNRIYGPAVAEWQVEMAATFTPADWDGKLDTEGSGLLSNYPSGMRKINNEFRDLYKAYDPNTAYVFLAKEAENAQVLGFMPRAKQFGYIFTGSHSDNQQVLKTIAHELGHGVFRLNHTFKEEPALAQGSTDNLMDYSGGTALYKHQWDLVHDPATVLGVFESDEDGAYTSIEYALKVFQQIRCGSRSKTYNLNFDRKLDGLLASNDRFGGTVGWYLSLNNNKQFLTLDVTVVESATQLNGESIRQFTLDFGKVKIQYVDHANVDHTTTKNRLAQLESYLFPKDNSDIIEDFEIALNLLDKSSLSTEDIEAVVY